MEYSTKLGMKIYRIEQLSEPIPIILEDKEVERMEELEGTQKILINEHQKLVGFFTDEYLEFISQLLTKYNITYKITCLTPNYS